MKLICYDFAEFNDSEPNFLLHQAGFMEPGWLRCHSLGHGTCIGAKECVAGF